MPLPNSKVIPDGWEAHHAPVAEGAMTATCTITRGGAGTGTFDPNAGKSTYTQQAPYYAGICRVRGATRVAGSSEVSAGEKPTAIRHYVVSIPLSAAQPNVNDLVMMTAAKDAAMVGMRLAVTDVTAGSLVWERDLVCEVHEATIR